MKFVAGGIRGSIPTANKSFASYGGDTSSYLLQSNAGDQIVVDLGSGVNNLFPYFTAPDINKKLLVLVTHFHLDHLLGLVLLPNLGDAKTDITVKARVHGEYHIEQAVNDLIKPPYWPLTIQAMSQAIRFADLEDSHGDKPQIFGDLEIRWCPQKHPGSSTAYRINETSTGKSVIIATDIEWKQSSKQEKADFLNLCSETGPPDILVMDGQFLEDEYARFTGWGHSTWSDVQEIGTASKAGQILIAHHSPLNDDERLATMETTLSGVTLPIRLARQDEVISL